ncbi:MAG: hypothetical protein JHD16_09145 [Solirubrobacteraceae bacterium]|nr:hypothetical protein [Solirubrobacteraceae bacterium]
MQRLRILLLPLLAILTLGATASSASAAKSSIRVGIGDQSVNMFNEQAWKDLKMKTTRYFIPWNALSTADTFQRDRAIQYVTAARANGVSVLLHVSTDDFTPKKAKLPSVSAYTAEVKKMVALFRPLGVKEWGVWNEANHSTQPTYKDPKRAAQFFRAMYTVVGSKDKIVALDVLDQGGVEKYQARFYAALTPTYRKRAKIVGIHNYGDVNRNRSTFTRNIIKTSKKYNRSTRFWFTETGGLVEFGKSFKCSTSRAASRTKNVFKLAKQFKSQGLDRILLYNYYGSGCGKTRFDAGLVGPDGQTRAGYRELKKILPGYSR